MNDERFDQLLDRLLEDDLGEAEAQELAAAARTDPARFRALRQQLVTWELWSQQHAPERSAEAFLRGLRTRQRAEAASDGFVTALHEQLEREDARDSADPTGRRGWFTRVARAALSGVGRDRWARWFGRGAMSLPPSPEPNPAADTVRHSRFVRWCLVGTSAAAAAVIVWLWTVPHAAHATVTLHGEAICTACELHETHDHLPAIRVRDGARTAIYYVDSGMHSIVRLGDYCVAPFPVVATGMASQHGTRRTIAVDAARRERRPADGADGRVLFPF